jgi:hypothetical protein
MTHKEKVDFLREEMARHSVDSLTIAPLFVRILWAIGLAIPPPVFWRPASLAIFYGSLGLIIGFLLWAAHALPDSPTLQILILAALALLYSIWGSWYYRRKARQLNLPSWEKYHEPVEAVHSDGRVKPT